MDEPPAKQPRLDNSLSGIFPQLLSDGADDGLNAGGRQDGGRAQASGSSRGRPFQEKRTCPICGMKVGPRFGTGSGGEGSQCPGYTASGQKCTYVFAAGRRKMAHKEMVEKCSAITTGPLADVKAAQAKAFRKVVTEAAKTGGSAVLLWYNPVNEDEDASKDLGRMLMRMGRLPSCRREGEYAYRAVGSGGAAVRCGVVLQASTGTEAADAILEQVASAVNATAVRHLQRLADKAALEAMSPAIPALQQVGAAAATIEVGRPAGNQQEPPLHQQDLGAGVMAMQDLEGYLQRLGLFDACYAPLAQNGLTLDVMRAIISANCRQMPAFVEALKVVGVCPGHAMVLFANLNKPNQ